jgi:hypothetical protein
VRSARLSLSRPGVGTPTDTGLTWTAPAGPGSPWSVCATEGTDRKGVCRERSLPVNVLDTPPPTRQLDRAGLIEKGKNGRGSTKPITHSLRRPRSPRPGTSRAWSSLAAGRASGPWGRRA